LAQPYLLGEHHGRVSLVTRTGDGNNQRRCTVKLAPALAGVRFSGEPMPQVTITIQTQHQLQVVWGAVKTSRGTLVGICDALGLTVEANDEAELRSMIPEAQHFLMVDLLEDGELPKFLHDRGWRAMGPLPPHVPEGGVKFDVPFRVEHVVHGHP
jgi:hypothetical protein